MHLGPILFKFRMDAVPPSGQAAAGMLSHSSSDKQMAYVAAALDQVKGERHTGGVRLSGAVRRADGEGMALRAEMA